MKVGIITFHRAQNFGAMLQAHALQKVVEELGNECQIIDYRCTKLENSYKNFIMPSKTLKGFLSGIIHLPNRYVRNKKFMAFSNAYYKLTKHAYNEGNIADIDEGFEAYIVGSDQVWNPNITGSDLNYFLDFLPEGSKKIAYAASLGVTHFEKNIEKYLCKQLCTFSEISVREESSVSLIQNVAGITPEVVMDPVFLVNSEYWKMLARKERDNKRYVFLYELHEHNTREYAKKIANEKNIDILLIPNDLRGGIRGIKKYAPTVEQFLSYIMNAEYVVTDSFHVAAFSVIFHKQFSVLMKTEQTSLNSRLTSLMNKLNLNNCILDSPSKRNEIYMPINYYDVEMILNEEREKSMSFLRRALCLEVAANGI